MARILVVEPEAGNRYFFVVTLRRSGYDVVEACTGAEALRSLEQHSDIALILTALRIPDFGGVQLVDEFKRRYPSLPVIIASAYCQLPWAAAAVEKADATLTKPFGFDELRQLVARMVPPMLETA